MPLPDRERFTARELAVARHWMRRIAVENLIDTAGQLVLVEEAYRHGQITDDELTYAESEQFIATWVVAWLHAPAPLRCRRQVMRSGRSW